MHIKIITQVCEFPQIMCNRLQSTKQGFSPSVVSYLGGTMPDYITCMHTNQHHQSQHKKQTTITAAVLDRNFLLSHSSLENLILIHHLAIIFYYDHVTVYHNTMILTQINTELVTHLTASI